ncbi:hypothetical protein AaE_007926 [Aphanomyces astaci]|uniref:Major facilitator superfamily (MFS) profile domain-containing protein n=1 Tax=Aphanomyces astaci TaxID=112090 RepID=A0A6A5AEV6_APHAT|nr:hypothetical protein AaE_007926 [Aphanomyces astaci]
MPLLDDHADEDTEVSTSATTSDGHGDDDERSLLNEGNVDINDGADCNATDVDTEVESIGCGFFHHRMVIILGLGNAADAVEILAMNYILADYGTITSWESSCLTAAVFAGMLVGGLVGGVMADAYGRRPIVLLNLGINAVSALLSALSPSLNWLILFRCLAGIGNIVGTNTRILPWTNWRHFAACAGLPALTSFLLTYCYVPESPRFLVSQHQYAEAASVLARIAHVNGQREYATPCLTQSDKKADHPHRRQDGKDPYRMQWFVASSRLRKVALCLIVTSFALSFGSYGISTWITKLFVSIGLLNPYANAFLYAGANLPGNLLSYLVVDAWGPSVLLKTSLVGAAATALLFSFQLIDTDDAPLRSTASSASSITPTTTQGHHDSSRAVVVLLACVFNAITTAAWNAVR